MSFFATNPSTSSPGVTYDVGPAITMSSSDATVTRPFTTPETIAVCPT